MQTHWERNINERGSSAEWETQIDFIKHFDLERITAGTEDAFLKYLCHTKDGKSFRTRNISELRTDSWTPLSVISASNPAFRPQ